MHRSANMSKKSNVKKNATAKSAEMAPLEQAPRFTDTKNAQKEVKAKFGSVTVCCVCGSDKTAKRMSGKLRWHEVNETEGTLCHSCWLKSRDDETTSE